MRLCVVAFAISPFVHLVPLRDTACDELELIHDIELRHYLYQLLLVVKSVHLHTYSFKYKTALSSFIQLFLPLYTRWLIQVIQELSLKAGSAQTRIINM